MTLLGRTIRRTVWTFGGQQARAGLALAVSIFTGRLISPTELGLYALASSIVSLVATGTSLQSGGYYVVAEDATPKLLRTGLTLEFGLGTVIFTIVCGAAAILTSSGEAEFAGLL